MVNKEYLKQLKLDRTNKVLRPLKVRIYIIAIQFIQWIIQDLHIY